VDNADYLDIALRLANASLDDVDALRATLHGEPWWADRVSTEDLRVLRSVASGLREVFDAATRSDAVAVLDATNALLAKHRPRPRLSAGHDPTGAAPNWHVHVADVDAPAGTEVAAAAAWGAAHGIVHYGLDRWGRCAANGCANFFVDTSTNRARRFCSPRCANRIHVAAFRSRNR
jgi:predicted RNA-binding Zn ribbon-like protein